MIKTFKRQIKYKVIQRLYCDPNYFEELGGEKISLKYKDKN